jgi:predicted esterase
VLRAGHKGRGNGWRVAVIAVAVVAMLGIGAAGASAAGRPGTGATVSKVGEWPSTPAATCKDVDIIGARGSGEPAGGEFHGLGAPVNKMISVVQGQLKKFGYSYATFAVNYPAASVDVLKPTAGQIAEFIVGAMDPLDPGQMVINAVVDWYNHQVKKYLASIAAGVSATVKEANKLHSACSSTLIAFVGYSQGAMVVHQAMQKLSGTITTCVKGALVLADGNRVPNTKAQQFGTSLATGEGIQTWITHTAHVGPKAHDFPSWAVNNASLASICNKSDFVCDFNFFTGIHWSRGFTVHTSYAVEKNGKWTYEPVLTTAANFVGEDLVNILMGRGNTCH